MGLTPDSSIGGTQGAALPQSPHVPDLTVAEQQGGEFAAVSPGGILSGMASIEASVGALEQAVVELCDRLHSIQKPEFETPPEPNVVPPVEPVRSEHAVYLFQVDERLRALCAKVVANNQRLDI